VDRPIAVGKKTRLRFLKREDVDAMVRWGRHENPLLACYNMPTMTPRQCDEWYRVRVNRPDFRMFVILDRDGAVIGRLSIREVDNRRRRARLGIALDPDHVGRGLGTDAIIAFMDFYFNHLRFETLVLDVASHNQQARRCYEKCGFRYTSEHWQKAGPDDGASAAVFSDERCRDVRRFFRQTRKGIDVLFCDMEITREQYLAGQQSPD
jgi:RimJ/RimL family protein N-acetyltransferase